MKQNTIVPLNIQRKELQQILNAVNFLVNDNFTDPISEDKSKAINSTLESLARTRFLTSDINDIARGIIVYMSKNGVLLNPNGQTAFISNLTPNDFATISSFLQNKKEEISNKIQHIQQQENVAVTKAPAQQSSQTPKPAKPVEAPKPAKQVEAPKPTAKPSVADLVARINQSQNAVSTSQKTVAPAPKPTVQTSIKAIAEAFNNPIAPKPAKQVEALKPQINNAVNTQRPNVQTTTQRQIAPQTGNEENIEVSIPTGQIRRNARIGGNRRRPAALGL